MDEPIFDEAVFRTQEQAALAVSNRVAVWKLSADLVEPIVEKHGLQPYSTGPNLFANTVAKTTAVDQHIDQIMRVADWLLET